MMMVMMTTLMRNNGTGCGQHIHSNSTVTPRHGPRCCTRESEEKLLLLLLLVVVLLLTRMMTVMMWLLKVIMETIMVVVNIKNVDDNKKIVIFSILVSKAHLKKKIQLNSKEIT